MNVTHRLKHIFDWLQQQQQGRAAAKNEEISIFYNDNDN